MVKVSVILPVYGVAQYIEKCTQSLLDQTLYDMEFIFVDDPGSDNSIDLVKKMIENHPRKQQFVFLKPEHNLGAGMARNFAIPQAKGEYIAFVDSDDWVEPAMFRELYDTAVCENHCDLCCCQMQKEYPNGDTGEILKNPKVENGIITREQRSYLLTHYVSLFASFIYRRDFLTGNNILFAEDRSADDSYFVTCAWMKAKSIAYVDKPFYRYLIRPGSVTTTKDSKKYLKRLSTFRKLMTYAKDNGVYADYKGEIDFIYIKKGYLSSVFNYISNSMEPKNETICEIYDELVRQVPDYRENRFYNQEYALRIMVWMLRKMPGIAKKMVSAYVRKKNIVV